MKKRNQCILCGSETHTEIVCEKGQIKTDLTIGEWLTVYVLRRFRKISAAAQHYRVSTSGMSMALSGTRPVPRQLLRDAGVSLSVQVQLQEPVKASTCTESQTAAEEVAP